MASKLIYINQGLNSAQSWLHDHDINSTKTDWNNNTNAFYRSLVFTSDGHLLTHGQDFSSAASWGVGMIYNSSQGTVSSAAPNFASGNYVPYYTPTKTGDNVTSVAVGWVDLSTLLTTTGASTITTVGTITTGVWHGSTITVPYGGTGATSFTQGGILYGNGTSAIGVSAAGTAGQVLLSGGTGAPTWRNIATSVDLTHTAASNNSLVTEAAVANAISAGFAANDAMVFKGTLGTGGTITSVPTKNYLIGQTYRVIEAGEYAGQTCEVGDLLIAIADGPTTGNTVTNNHWTVAQTNIDGAVTTTSTLTSNGIVLGGGNKTVDILTTSSTSGYLKPNGSSAPAWSSFGKLTVDGTADFVFNPSADKTLKVGKGLDVTSASNVYTLGHTNQYFGTGGSQSGTAGIYKIAYDDYGHVSKATSWDPSTITFSNVKNIRTGGSNLSTQPSFDPDGTALAIQAGDGLVIYGSASSVTIGHSTTGAATFTAASRKYVSGMTIDSYGHVTAVTMGTETVTNTWRPVYAWKLSDMANATDYIDNMLANGTGTRALAFSSTFGYTEKSVTTDGSNSVSVSEIDLVWCEIDSNGTANYVM